MLRRTSAALHFCTLPKRAGGKWRVFVDLDGVLADFEKGIADLGISAGDLKADPSATWARLREHEDFFSGLDWMPGAEEMWGEIAPFSPVVLTGLPKGDWAAPQKRAWVEAKLGSHITTITCMKFEKPRLSSKGNLLIDDAGDTCTKWAQHGGVAIHHITPEATVEKFLELVQKGV